MFNTKFTNRLFISCHQTALRKLVATSKSLSHPTTTVITLFSQCSSTGVPRNLRVPRVASKGFTELNREMGTTTFVANRCVFWALSASKMHLQSYSAPPGPLAGEEGLAASPKNSSPSWISALWASRVPFPQDKLLATPFGSMSSQNCYKGFPFKEKVEKHWFRR